LTVFHVVPTLAAAMKAVDAGVDGLVVEGGEGGGFKNPQDVSTMVLLPLVASRLGVPIIAAGGITDGASMAAAFALGAEGVQMGTRMVSAAESPVHDNWKNAIVAAAETDTVFLNRFSRPGLRALRTERTTLLERQDHVDMSEFGRAMELYFGGDLEAAIALSGQVVGRIDAVLPVQQIIEETMASFAETCARLGRVVATS
jgi:enoyl-[acyl-carrier protein] reductase II